MTLFTEAIDQDKGAVFDPDRIYRYLLWRQWREGSGTIVWLMLNPSTVDEQRLDPTLRRCRDYSKRWGYARMEIVNLFAYRSTDSDALAKESICGMDIVGNPANDAAICSAAFAAESAIVCGWGAKPVAVERAAQVLRMLRAHGFGDKLRCLHRNIDGSPQHPLYLAKACTPCYRLDD